MTTAQATMPPTFNDLLRSWRKTRKLSQWDLALHAGISQRHLSFLESGRSAPSRDMVTRLADSLDIPLREQNTLLNAAGFASLYQASSIDKEDMPLTSRVLSVMLEHHEPYPALVVDRNWNLLLTNNANVRLISEFVDPVNVWQSVNSADTPNIIKLVLHPDGLKPHIQNWASFYVYFIHRLERELAGNPYNSGARELLDEVLTFPGVEGDMAQSLSVPVDKPCLSMELTKGDLQLSLFTMVSTFGTPQDVTLQELRIETFFPADQASEAYIRGLVS